VTRHLADRVLRVTLDGLELAIVDLAGEKADVAVAAEVAAPPQS